MIKDVCLHSNTTVKAEWGHTGLYVCVALYHCETSWCYRCCSACTSCNIWTL